MNSYKRIFRWWFWLRDGDRIQFGILIVLVVNVIFFWIQYRSTQLLNKPLCAVKQLNVERALKSKDVIDYEKLTQDQKNIIKISTVIKNFGKYKAKNASIEWEMIALNRKSKGEEWKAGSVVKKSTVLTDITILPDQEFEHWLIFIPKKDLDEVISGYEKAVNININIRFLNMDEKTETYKCIYQITKMLAPEEYLYEVSLVNSSAKI
jgi:hypothetical protein